MVPVSQLIAKGDWLRENHAIVSAGIKEVMEADDTDLNRLTSLETSPPVIAVIDMRASEVDIDEVFSNVSIALDNVQDPGNLGTIIRTADWFGIINIFCNEGCADIYNPKVVQASMGAMLSVKVHYLDLKELLKQNAGRPDYEIYGTFMDGTPVSACKPLKKGLIIFGNESRGISLDIISFIKHRITIPPGMPDGNHIESLNVASAVAIVCAQLTRQ